MADVFISYSRKDKEFVQRLHDALQEHGRDTWVDWENIPLTAEWMKEVTSGIESADSFAFIISPDSIASEICGQELAHALAFNKRLVPIVYREVDAKSVPPALASHNWIFFRASDDFQAAVDSLIKALDTDLAWVHEHTHLLMRAIEWDHNRREPSCALQGTELHRAEQWLAQAGVKGRDPTPLQTQFILKSRHIASRRHRRAIGALTTAISTALVLSLLVWQGRLRQQQYQAGRLQEAGILALVDNNAQRAEVLFANALTLDDRLETREWLLQARARAARLKWIRRSKESGPILAFSPDGRHFLSQGRDGTVHLEESGTDQAPISLSTTGAEARCAAFSPDGSLLALGTQKGIQVFRCSGLQVFSPTPNTEYATPVLSQVSNLKSQISLNCLAISPDDSLLAAGSEDQTITLWDLRTGQCLRTLRGHKGTVQCVAFSPDGRRLASGSADYNVGLWDVRTGRLLCPWLEGHEDSVAAVAFSADGKRLASGSDDNYIRIWDAFTGRRLRVLTGHQSSVRTLAFSSDNRYLASGSEDQTIRIWDVQGEDPELWKGTLTLDSDQEITTVAFSTSPDPPVGNRESAIQNPKSKIQNPYTLLLAGGSGGSVRLWDISSIGNRPEIMTLVGHTKQVTDGKFSPDCRWFASASADKTVRLWDLQTQTARETTYRDSLRKDQVSSVAFSPDGRLIASGGKDAVVRLWDAATGIQYGRPLIGHTDQVWNVSFSPDGRILASSGDDGTIRFWDPQTGRSLGVFPANAGKVPGIAFSPNGRQLVAGGEDGSLRLWDVPISGSGLTLRANLTNARVLPASAATAIWNVSFSPDGRYVVAAGANGSVLLWDLMSQHPPRTLGVHEGPAWDAAFSPDGHTISSAGNDSTVRLWDTQREGYKTLRTRPGPVWFVSFSRDGRMLASGNQDNTIVIWRLNQLNAFYTAPPDALLKEAEQETGLVLDLKTEKLHSIPPAKLLSLQRP